MRVLLAAPLVVLLGVAPAPAQDRLTLEDAIARAQSASPAARAARAAAQEGAERLRGAQAGWWPRVDVSEAVHRGDQPVYVFGSLLSQRRFTAANFAIDALNHPDALTNHRTAITAEQPLFSAEVLTGVRAARVGRALAAAGREAVERDLAVDATRAFGEALVAQSASRAAAAAVTSAEEDLRRTRERRAAGVVTEADVLLVEVHLARMRARRVEATARRQVALAALNRVMGEPLDRDYVLQPATPDPSPHPPAAQLEAAALLGRPEARQAALQEQLARVHQAGARAALLPQVGLQGGYEWNGARFGDRSGAWNVSVQARWNLFAGLGDLSRIRAAGAARDRAEALRTSAEQGLRLEARTARSQLEAALAREGVGRTAVLHALESQRIIRDRYESGLAGVHEVLRAANAVLDAEALRIAAVVDVMVGRAAVRKATGEAAGS